MGEEIRSLDKVVDYAEATCDVIRMEYVEAIRRNPLITIDTLQPVLGKESLSSLCKLSLLGP